MVRRSFLLGLFVFAATGASAQQVGPKSGSLVIVGGNMQDPAIVNRFIDLAGGPDRPIVIIPTAGEDASYNRTGQGCGSGGRPAPGISRSCTRAIASNQRPRRSSHPSAPRAASSSPAAGSGGWQTAYLNTRVHRELQALLDRGGVIGGSSAGATILGSFLVRGDTKGNEEMIGDHVEGMAFLKNSAIDQHLLRRNRHFDLVEVIEKHPALLGIGLDENTAIVVRGDEFDVIGQSYVVIYDNRVLVPPTGRFYFLAPGDRCDLVKREASRSSQQFRPLGVAKPGKWPGVN